MPTPPLLTTPTQPATAPCSECGDALVRTGQPTTFADIGRTTPSEVGGRRVRGHAPFKGWVPSLLVAICPTCDGHTERPDDDPDTEPAPSVTEVMESYLERYGRLHDEAQAEDDGA